MLEVIHMPKIKSLRQFAYTIKNFPITGLGVVQLAQHTGCDDELIDFLKRFSKEVVFHSRSDFLQQCSLDERMLREEERQPVEILHEAEED